MWSIAYYSVIITGWFDTLCHNTFITVYLFCCTTYYSCACMVFVCRFWTELVIDGQHCNQEWMKECMPHLLLNLILLSWWPSKSVILYTQKTSINLLSSQGYVLFYFHTQTQTTFRATVVMEMWGCREDQMSTREEWRSVSIRCGGPFAVGHPGTAAGELQMEESSVNN